MIKIKRFYSKNELLGILIKLNRKLKRSPKVYDMGNSNNLPAMNTYVYKFGSWNNALKEVGIKLNKRRYNKEELLICLRDVAKKKNRPPIIKDLEENSEYPDRCVFENNFGSWNNALREAGLDVRYLYRKWSKDELIKWLRKKAKELGRTPGIRDMDKDKNSPGKNTYRKFFGSWTKAIKVAGLRVRRFYTRKDLLFYLRQLAKELGRPPLRVDIINNKNYPSTQPYITKFGSWSKALLLAGLKPSKGYLGDLWIKWQLHCEDMAKVKYGNIVKQPRYHNGDGIPDIWVPHLNKYIDAKTSGYKYFKKQLKKYCNNSNNAKLEVWCVFKGFETPGIKYLYGEELAKEMEMLGRKDLAKKCYKFINDIKIQR